MNADQLRRMREDNGFIAALDQSGGSTPKALDLYGIPKTAYKSDDEMYDLVHEMRTRVIASPAFTKEHILGVILFEMTMDRMIDEHPTATYLWDVKGIVPFLKIDVGLADARNGVQVMKPIPALDRLLDKAVAKGIFGTKMRSVIHEADKTGIEAVVAQQMELAGIIWKAGLVPIIEPEVSIGSPAKREAEIILKDVLLTSLAKTDTSEQAIFKLSLPCEDNFYSDLISAPHTIRVVALSGGYTREEADGILARNHGMIASFSRALLEGLRADQSAHEFNQRLEKTIEEVYQASVS